MGYQERKLNQGSHLGSVVDLFCGVSGFGLGALYAGANVVASIDKDAELTSTHKWNLPHIDLHHVDISALDPKGFARWLNSLYGRIDGVIGGPPCQGFSEIGKRNHSDERNALLIKFAEIVVHVQPDYFVFENVRGLLFQKSAPILDKTIEILSRSYNISDPTILDAQNFGVPTSRQRVFVIGFRKSLGIAPSLNNRDLRTFWYGRTTVRQAISDLPPPIPKTWNEAPYQIWGKYPTLVNRRSRYALRQKRMPQQSSISVDEIRMKVRAGMVSGIRGTKHTTTVIHRLSKVLPGEVDPISKCPRLEWNGVCPTLRAGTGPDRGSYQSIRPIHPEENRVITIREAARLQGFPDWYQFHPTNWHGFRMIGNSVVPAVAKHVMSHVDSLLKGIEPNDQV